MKKFILLIILLPIMMFSQEKVSFLNPDNEEITFKISNEYYLVNYKTLTDENIIKVM